MTNDEPNDNDFAPINGVSAGPFTLAALTEPVVNHEHCDAELAERIDSLWDGLERTEQLYRATGEHEDGEMYADEVIELLTELQGFCTEHGNDDDQLRLAEVVAEVATSRLVYHQSRRAAVAALN